MGYERIVKYGNPLLDEYITIKTITDDIRFIKCMQMYKAFETIEDLENAITKEGLQKLKNVD